MEKVRATSKIQQESAAKELKNKLKRNRKRSAELDNLIQKVYESYANGKITDTDRADKFLELVKKYTDFSILTTPMLYEFVDKILVQASKKVDGERVQTVDIYLRFIGKFDVLMPEPTPEELAEQEEKRKLRAKQREYFRRAREKKQAKLIVE